MCLWPMRRARNIGTANGLMEGSIQLSYAANWNQQWALDPRKGIGAICNRVRASMNLAAHKMKQDIRCEVVGSEGHLRVMCQDWDIYQAGGVDEYYQMYRPDNDEHIQVRFAPKCSTSGDIRNILGQELGFSEP